MVSDKRKKGCPNESCEIHKKKVMLKSEIDYCSKCGSKLIYVCSKCSKEIEDIDKKHQICCFCEAYLEEKRSHRIEKVKVGAGKAGKVVVSVVSPIVLGVVGKVIKDGQKEAINAGVKTVESVAKAMLKK